jgi:hypothetical protein
MGQLKAKQIFGFLFHLYIFVKSYKELIIFPKKVDKSKKANKNIYQGKVIWKKSLKILGKK